jgi:ABC-type transport system involved in multi-copper enzyme maturation permease subunit
MNYLPGIGLSLLFALLIGFIFHFWKGGGIFRLLTIELFSIIGFAIGHWIGMEQEINFIKVGWVFLGFGIIGSIIFSFGALWLTNIRFEKQD